MTWVFVLNGEIKESDTDPGDCVKIKCATFREKREARLLLSNPLRREKLLRKQSSSVKGE